jgi:predicted Zn-dependent peptidase
LTDVQRGYDVSRVEEYPEAVKALTREQVNSAIKNHLNPSVMVTVKAGSVGPTSR